jgi:AcrR family transcriptional regulator
VSDKARQILKTAERLFAEGRYHEVTLDEICKQAGVGKGTVYRYFEGKEGLYYQVILSGLDDLVDSVKRVGERESDPGRGIEKAAGCIAHFFASRRCLFRLMWSEQLRGSARKAEVRKQLRRKTDKALGVVAGFVQNGVQEGRYRTPFSPQACARLLMGMIRVGLRHKREMPGGREWPLGVARLLEKGILADNARDS